MFSSSTGTGFSRLRKKGQRFTEERGSAAGASLSKHEIQRRKKPVLFPSARISTPALQASRERRTISV